MDIVNDTDNAVGSTESKVKNFRHVLASWRVSRPKSAAVKNIDIADIWGSKILDE